MVATGARPHVAPVGNGRLARQAEQWRNLPIRHPAGAQTL